MKKDLKAEVLGQLLVMQSMIINLPDEKSIYNFVCHGLKDIPGVSSATHSPLETTLKNMSKHFFPLSSKNQNKGFIAVDINDLTQFYPYKDYLHNFFFMLQIILEERDQRKTIEKHSQNLEKEVQKQTKQLREEIEERKQIEKQLIQAKLKAEESDKLKSAFLANMSHEIRTPMNGILGFSDLLRDSNLSNEYRQEFHDLIQKSGHRMLNLVDSIMNLSKIEAGIVTLKQDRVKIPELLQSLISFFQPEAQEKGLKLYFLEPELRISEFIATDLEKLYSILSNLIKNSIKYSQSGEILLGYEKTATENGNKPSIRFFVKDTGIGIPLNQQHNIFDRFSQGDLANKQAFQGSGLGLAICKAYVELLGGTIWVSSEENEGASFFFTTPLIIHEDLTDTQEEEFLQKKNVHNPLNFKILVVEDDFISQLYLQNILLAENHDVLTASTGTQAVELCKDHPDIDLILMDIQLPEMDGYTAVELIREFNQEVKIISQTAYCLEGDREKCIAAGCDDYLSKPISKELLLSKIKLHF